MDTNKILSADFIDLLFDNRNKEYGAYELRKTYQTRLTKALIFAGILVGLAFTGVVFANKLEPKQKSMFVIRELSGPRRPESQRFEEFVAEDCFIGARDEREQKVLYPFLCL